MENDGGLNWFEYDLLPQPFDSKGRSKFGSTHEIAINPQLCLKSID